MEANRPGTSVKLYFLLFGISGFSGLIYESIWTHYIKLFLGHAAYAQTLVLAIFMGGMAAGAWLAAQRSGKWTNLLIGYALVEGLIGLVALLFHGAFVGATNLAYDALIPALGSPGAVLALKWTLSALFILPQSVLLGMTFPLMSGGIIRRFPDAPGGSLAMLYFTNSFGAAIGVLASGFVLIERFGLPGTMLTAGLINVLLAIVVWRLAKGYPAPVSGPMAERTPAGAAPRWYALMLGVALVTGAASFLYEIAWIRMLSLVLGSSTHSFELMLSAFILGLAFGGLFIKRRIDRLANPVRFLGYVQVAMGLLALATLPLYGSSFEWMQFVVRALARSEQGYGIFHVASHVICLLLMFPATFCAGMTLPLLTYILVQRGHGEKSIGRVYAANTLGAIVGVLAAVHLIMPALGVKGVVAAGAALDMALGLVLLGITAAKLRRIELPATAVAAGMAFVLVVALVQLDPHRMVAGVFRDGRASLPKDYEMLYRRDGKTATIGLYRGAGGGITISTNGKPDAKLMPLDAEPSTDEPTMVLAGAFALGFHPTAKRAANIGMGSGLTTHVLLATPQLEQLDTIEIERFMVEAARGFGDRVGNAFADPRSRIHIEDAKTFFSTQRAQYDIIVSEPSNPWVSGVSSLFSTEFYQRVRHHLKPGGIFVQWVQLYEIDVPLLASIFKAFSPQFTDYAAFQPNGGDLLLIARNGGPIGEIDAATLFAGGLAKELARVNVKSLQDVELRRLGGKAMLAPLFDSYGVPVNSDYFPFLDQHAARARFQNSDAAQVGALRLVALPVTEMLEGRRAAARETAITADASFDRVRRARSAMAARDALLGKGSFDAMLPDTRRDAYLVSLMLEKCDPRTDWDHWLDSLVGLSVDLMPYLAPAEVTAVLARLERHPCAKRLTGRVVDWLSLLRAVANRDADTMARRAEELLAKETLAKRRNRLTLLVDTAMLGHLAAGRPQASLAVWEKHNAEILRGGEITVDSRLMVVLSQPGPERAALLDPRLPTRSATPR